MAMDQSALLDLLAALKDTDVSDRIRTATEHLYQELIDAEATAVIGAGPWQRTQARTALRNGSRDRVLTTTAGDLDLRIPKLRTGSFFPSLLERRRRVDQALFAVVMEAYLHGVSTRKVDDLVRALGADTGISKSEVSRICAGLDEEVSAFRDRSLADAGFPYVFLDATYCKARVGRRVVSQAVVIATGVRADGHREVLGFDVGDSENGAFWTSFLRSLKARGLGGVALVISDAHEGLKTAIASVLLGSSWQRCRVHFTRNVLDAVSKTNAEMVAAAIRTIFAQPDAAHVAEQFEVIATMLTRSHPKVGHMLTDAREDLLAFTAFPASHWKKIWSTNPLERLNKEVKRRTDVVGVFPNPAALLRLAGAVLVEAHDEWAATDRRYLSENSMAQLATMTLTTQEVDHTELLTA
ncbi:IS256 family transposase [Cellulomonas sp. WB94]|uniref:IS256 family transposase n=2 Tax=Cellulomonas sp. WB94 TaxID=2173174 RepID=UPI000D573E68|nr:IS256 family transposase [Cellulomonas sp. WB94]PVU81136.1 IS256 family transposase [Cellulomonas sp. WB94]PVU81383.1 IS256 family transposase [Cellulomonas sp. WB94]PVU82036.1 IS256 family transposase [Cellulomonas sp. WB94]PVU82269.1 IS256 family transposase [Cellulomonas sp. WB94]PVU82909.1 IS256 family transposase [Cellulomonas sp. WB94]